MAWIKNRINAEHKKHKKLDWSRLAEAKINSTIKEIIEKSEPLEIQYESYDSKELIFYFKEELISRIKKGTLKVPTR